VNIYETDNPVFVGVPYDEIQSGDVSTVLKILQGFLQNRSAVVNGRARVSLFFEGYDDDPREVFDIPEIRRYAKALDEAFPYLFYFATLGQHGGNTLKVLALCLCRVVKVSDGSKPETNDYAQFLFSHITALNELCDRFQLGDAIKLQVTNEAVAHLVPDRNSM
jgi:hypothetical protein